MERAEAFALEFARTHAREAARILSGFDVAELAAYLETLPPADASILLRQLVPHLAAGCLEYLSVLQGSMALEALPADVCALLLRRVEPGRRQALLESLSAGLVGAIRSAMRYSDSVVGAHMDPRVPALDQDQTVESVLEMLRRGVAAGGTLFVIDEAYRLTGMIPVSQLFVLPGEAQLRAVQEKDVQSLSARQEIAGLLDHPVWNAADTVPVVDQKGQLLGGLRRRALSAAIAHGLGAEGHDQSMATLLFDCADVFWTACADLFAPAGVRRQERGN